MWLRRVILFWARRYWWWTTGDFRGLLNFIDDHRFRISCVFFPWAERRALFVCLRRRGIRQRRCTICWCRRSGYIPKNLVRLKVLFILQDLLLLFQVFLITRRAIFRMRRDKSLFARAGSGRFQLRVFRNADLRGWIATNLACRRLCIQLHWLAGIRLD